MKLPGRNQLIVIVGGGVILGLGMWALYAMELDKAREFLDFAGSFGWKTILGAIGASAVIKGANALRK